MGAVAMPFEMLQAGLSFQAEKYAALDNMQQLRRSAGMEEANAVGALRQGVLQAGAARQRASEVLGQQQLGFALGNVAATSGTAAQLQRSTAAFGEVDAQTLVNNARRAALGHREVARRYTVEANRLYGRYGPEGTAETEAMALAGLRGVNRVLSSGLGGSL